MNVLLACVDDLKPAIGCYVDPLAKTPHIDRLATRGVRFERASCHQGVCSPSRNDLLEGLRPQTLGIPVTASDGRSDGQDRRGWIPEADLARRWSEVAAGRPAPLPAPVCSRRAAIR